MAVRRRRSVEGWALLAGLLCIACGGNLSGGTQLPATPIDCSAQASSQWEFWGFNTLVPENPSGSPPVIVRLDLAASVKIRVAANSAATTDCAAQSVDSVAWVLTNASVASISPDSVVEAWLTGAEEGDTGLTARIRFKDGTSRDVAPRFYFSGGGYRNVDVLRVVPPRSAAAGSRRVLEGRARLDPRSNTSAGWRVTLPFSVSESGLLRIKVDWVDPRSRVDFVALGPCPGPCMVISPTVSGVKPLIVERSRVGADAYTLRLDNLGSLEETVSYEVWLLPGG